MTLTAASVPNVDLFLEQINTPPGTWFAATDLANAFLFVHAHMSHRKQVALNWKGQQLTFTVLLLKYVKSPALCHNVVRRDLLSLPQAITLIHPIDDMMLTEPSEQEVITTLHLLVKHARDRTWERNMTTI